MKKILLLIMSLISFNIQAQDSVFSCSNPANDFLKQLIGHWQVTTKDRTSPGNYENNLGESEIQYSIEGCGIRESFRSIFKGKKFAREVMINGRENDLIEMSALDSEHNSFSYLEGKIVDGRIEVYWFRDKEVKRLQSKYILTIKNSDEFEFSSYLSMDYGETWALTHMRVYSRME